MRLRWWLVLVSSLALAISPAVSHLWADEILVGTQGDWNGASYTIDSGHVGAQAFSLGVAVHVSSIQVYMDYCTSSGTVLIQLTNQIGTATTAANVLAQGTLPMVAEWPYYSMGWHSLPVDVSLAPGTYYIAMGSGGSDVQTAWTTDETPIPGTVGAIGTEYFSYAGNQNSSFPAASFFVGTGGQHGFQVVGALVPQTVTEVLAFFDASVADGTLAGSGPGNSADGRRNALRNMIANAGALIDSGHTNQACKQLMDAYYRTDGLPKPPDFVAGPAAPGLAEKILLLMSGSCGGP